MADGGGHPSNLAVLTLGELERDPGVRDVFPMTDRRIAGRQLRGRIEQPDTTGPGAEFTEVDSAALEAAQRLRVRHALHLRPVLAPVGMTWIQKAGVQAGLAAQQQQALGIGVETAEGINAFWEREVGQRAPAGTRFGSELGQHAVRLVERDEHAASDASPVIGGKGISAMTRSLASGGWRAQLPPMRAVQFTGPDQMSVVSVADPRPGEGEVVVALRAAALNHRDVWIKTGQYAGLKWPCIPGSDGAGVVTETGPGVDPAWAGREVVINASFHGGTEERAQGGQFQILGLPRDGTLAERIAVPVTQLAARPAHLDWREAAALPLAGLTAYRALFARARLQKGERVLVSGVGGGVATFALQFAVAAGAEVWVTSSSADKIARAVSRGARGGFDYTAADWPAQAAARAGAFDVIVDSAGGEGFGRLVDAAAPGGRIVFFGATRGDAALPVRKVFWRQISLLGSTMGSPADWTAMIAFVAEKHLRPVVSEVFPLARAAEAFALMERGGQFGKIVVEMT